MKTSPIGIETQIENVLFGQGDTERKEVADKVAYVKENIKKVFSVNGKPVYLPSVCGDDLFYFLAKPPEWFKVTDDTKGIYYYPIQYAEIDFI